jgi:hypothetical protein
MNTQRGPDRVLVIGAIVVGLIVVGAAIVALTGSGPASLDPTTPEGTAQRYVQAILDNDIVVAQALLIDQDCRPDQRFFGNESVRARLVDSNVFGDTAVVEVEIIFSGGSPIFGGYNYSEHARIALEATDAGWGVTSDSWPYFVCEVRP